MLSRALGMFLCVSMEYICCTVQILSETFFEFLFSKKAERKTTQKIKMKLLPGCSSEWDLEAPSLLWNSMCQTRYESDFYIQNQNPFSWHSGSQSLEGTVQDPCLALKNGVLLLRFFPQIIASFSVECWGADAKETRILF